MRTSSVVVAGLLVGAAYCTGRCHAIRPDPEAVRRADSLATEVVRLESVRRAGRVADSARAESLQVYARTVQRLLTRTPEIRVLSDSLLVRVTDTALADSLRASLALERAASDSTVQVATLLVRLAADRAKAALLERDEYRTVALALQGQLAAAVRKPKAGRVRPCVFAGVGVGGATIGAGVCVTP